MRTAIVSLASIIMVAAAMTSGQSAQVPPLDMIRTAYGEIAKDKWQGKADPGNVSIAPKKLSTSWFTAHFIGALQKNAKCWASGKEGPISSVWFTGQDHDIKDTKIAQVEDT